MRRWLVPTVVLLACMLSSVMVSSLAVAASSATEMEQLSQDYQSKGFTIQWDEQRQLPRTLLNSHFRGDYDGRTSGTPEEIADHFLRTHAAALFGREDIAIGDSRFKGQGVELRTMEVRETLSGAHVWKLQFVSDVPVHQAWVQTNVDSQGKVMSVYSSFAPNVRSVDPRAGLTAEDAIAAARAPLAQQGPDRVSPVAELVILPDFGAGVLAWRTVIPTWAPYGDWMSFVAAGTGNVLETRNILIHGKPLGEAPMMSPPKVTYPDKKGTAPASMRKVDGSGDVLPMNPLNGEPTRYGLRDGDPVVGFVENKVLPRLDGTGTLTGAYADVFNSDQPRTVEPSLVFNYSPDVTNGAFHEVNVYWHIDFFQDYIQTSLNIFNANNRVMDLYAHQGEDDNSDYSSVQDRIRFGDGGVDDSEDGEVVLHEYGHAIHDNMVPGFVYAGESGAISEGFGDYIAASAGDNPLVAEWDATSYNPGPPPHLRRCDTTKHYPEDIVNQVHSDGEIISAAWWDLRTLIGQVAADQIIIESFNILGAVPSHTFEDFANASVQVDQALNGGANSGAIFSAYGGRGIGPDYLLDIAHAPLGDTEDTAGPYTVDVTIGHTSPITGPGAVALHWRLAGAPAFNDVVMSSSGVDAWTGDIPGTGGDATVEYYVSVTDDNAVSATAPPNAPTNVHSFNVGTDTILPVIVHTPIGNTALIIWPAVVQANITDNLGIASASVSWSLNAAAQADFALVDMGGGMYSAPFPIGAGSLAFGDIIDYTITAVDGSSAANSVSDGPHSFEIIDARGVVLIIDDDDTTKLGEIKYDDDKNPIDQGEERLPEEKGAGALQMAADLVAMGYVVTIETPAASDPASWGSYNVLIHSSGGNAAPLEDAAYRAALVAYAQGGGKLLVEGGEVGYDAASFPGYPDVAQFVTHSTDWDGDLSGDMPGVPGTEGHPIRNLPNAMPATLVLGAGGFADQDSQKPEADSYVVYGTTDEPANAGILVYDDNAAPASAQIVFYAFSYLLLADPAVASDLLENTLEFLLADEGGANSSISGLAIPQNTPDYSGVVVTAQPGGATFTTGPDGAFSLSGLFAGTYVVTATGPPGWESQSQVITVGENEALTGVYFELRAVLTFTFCSTDTPISIPDSNPLGVKSTILNPDMGEISDVTCSIDITHTWKGDLIVELTSPNATTVRLHNRTGSSVDNIITSYDDLTPVDGPGLMNDFNGEEALGLWQLFVSDNAGGDVGTINSWCVTVTSVQEGVVPVLVSGLSATMFERDVRIQWNAQGISDVESFNIMRSTGVAFERVNGEPIAPRRGAMSFTDAGIEVESGTQLSYQLQVVMKSGGTEAAGEPVAITYSPATPKVFALDQNYPNPFNPKTTISFALPSDGRTTLRVYDVAGRLVRTLEDGVLDAGSYNYEWNGMDSRGRTVSAGTYFYRVESGRYVATKAMVLVK